MKKAYTNFVGTRIFRVFGFLLLLLPAVSCSELLAEFTDKLDKMENTSNTVDANDIAGGNNAANANNTVSANKKNATDNTANTAGKVVGSFNAVERTYKVKHYLQKTDFTGYTEDTSDTLSGEAGKLTAAEPRKYDGFTPLYFEQQKIAKDSPTVVSIYYARTISMKVEDFVKERSNLTGGGIHLIKITDASDTNIGDLTKDDKPNEGKKQGSDFPVRILFDFSDSAALTKIPPDVFCYHNKLVGIILPDNLDTAPCFAFRACKDIKFFISDSNKNFAVSEDKRCLFSKNMKTLICFPSAKGDVTVPSGVEKIAAGAFANNSELTSVTLPASVRVVDTNVFQECEKLDQVTFEDPDGWYGYRRATDKITKTTKHIKIKAEMFDLKTPKTNAANLKDEYKNGGDPKKIYRNTYLTKDEL